MKEQVIKFLSVKDASQFITKASQCDFDIDVLYNHILLDGKSILALMSLDFSKPVTVKYSGSNQQFESFLSTLVLNS